MRRVVLVSNRVLDLRKAPQAGGVAVALADVVRLNNGLWFGWNGEITADDKVDGMVREGRLATVPLSEADHQGYYLGYANSVLWPVFHNRLDLAQFEAGFFDRFVDCLIDWSRSPVSLSASTQRILPKPGALAT